MELSKEILSNFSGHAPLFPLNDFVLFPKTGYTFKIFEPRYKDMINDIEGGDNLFCITKVKYEDEEGKGILHKVGTLAYVVDKKKLEDGNYNIIAYGVEKVKINEIDSSKSYRQAHLDLLNDDFDLIDEKKIRKKLVDKFISLLLSVNESLDEKIYDNSIISTEMLINLICFSLPISKEQQQELLELDKVSLRSEVIYQFMNSEIKAENDLSIFNQIMPIDPNWN